MIINIPEISVIYDDFPHGKLYHPSFEYTQEVFDNTHIDNNIQDTLFNTIIITSELPS